MKNKKEKILALLLALLFHLGILLLLYFAVIHAPNNNDEGGIPVNIGMVEIAAGEDYDADLPPSTEANTPPQETAQQSEPVEEPPILTDDNPDSEAIPEIKAQKPKQKAKKRIKEPLKRKQEQAREHAEREAERQRQKERAAARASVANAFSKAKQGKAAKGTGQSGTGVQGSPDGNVREGGETHGVGGYGSWQLGGRSLGSGLPRPVYSAQVEGTIVINITVNPAGQVIEASIGPGTNIDNPSMRNNAIRAAKRSRFNRVDGIRNQKGKIIYKFRLTS